MRRQDAVYYPVYVGLLGAAEILAILATVPALPPFPWPPVDVMLLGLAALCSGLAFSLRPSATLSLDLALILAAALLLPLPMALLLGGGAGLAASAAGVARRGAPAGQPAQAVEASFGLMALAGAASGAVTLARPVVARLEGAADAFLTLAGFTLIVAAHLSLIALSEFMRARPPAAEAGRYLRGLFPYDLLALPLGVLIAVNFRHGERVGFTLLAALTLVAVLLVRRFERTRSDLRSLDEIGRSLSGFLSPPQILETLALRCRELFGADGFVAALYDRSSGRLLDTLTRDAHGAAPRLPVLESASLVRWALSAERSLILRAGRAGRFPPPVEALRSAPAVRSMMFAGLRLERQPAGFLAVQSVSARAFDAHDLAVLRAIAQQASIALENARNYERAIRDAMTGLYRQEYFFQRLEAELARSERYGSPLAVLMLDLDGFREMNNRHGHLAGDHYLRALGEAIRAKLRGADLPCRFGGEEFCILLPETDMDGARVIAERVRVGIASLQVRDDRGQVLRTTASLGVAVHPGPMPETGKALVERADRALLAAKGAGKNRVVAAAA